MSAGLRKYPTKMWVLFDISNGHYPHKNYMWWFTSRKKAQEHKREQNSNPGMAALIGPIAFVQK